ncbi:MAG: Selenocysteine-specific elongation factor [Syntrophorhabdaceae bacterium PtaU1.Bin034]|nr:MAG: Selenocysteine-specific elongation factor [Syntrophorhabdaceae bacterium PtaU1.Bin034]
MKQVVIGTAGHIDHGKTALIKALTGIDCDRLKEEKERGITIELGFAYYRFGDDILVGIVDVPGHERFVKHMVAGAWGIDMVLFVVAADESVMPQTREHMDICELLGIRRGIVAITKKDLADEDMIELVKEEVEDLIKGRFLEGAPIIPVSAVTGENIDVLRAEIKQKATDTEERSRSGIFRLPVDRVFTIKGFGTIVTGTCISGSVRVGEEVEIYPTGKKARVRNVQAYHEDVKEAGAGQRVALNLQGIEKQDIERGAIIGTPGTLLLTSRIDASLRYLKLPFKAIKNNAILRFHVATTQVEARLILLDRASLEPGDEAFVQFSFSQPIVVQPGDRFILRGSYAIQTLGGGVVLDIAPGKHKRQSADLGRTHELLQSGTLRQRAEYHMEKGGYRGVSRQYLAALLGLNQDAIEKFASELTNEGRVRSIGKILLPEERFQAYKQLLKSLLRDFHEKNPLKIGISREELRTRLPEVDPQIFQMTLEDVVREGGAEIEKDRVGLPRAFQKPDQSVQKLEDDIMRILDASGLTPPGMGEIAGQLGIKEGSLRDVLGRLVYQGKVVKIKGDMYFSGRHIEEFKKTVRERLIQKKEMLPADFKALTGLSRKYMIPLLEHLDEIKLTIRTGDKRVLRSGS